MTTIEHIFDSEQIWDFCLGARSLLLAPEECVEGYVGDLADLESDSGNVSNGVTLTTESRDQNLTSYQVWKCE